MRLVDADALLEEMCEACDREACEGMGAESKRMVCYSARIIKEAPTIKAHDDKYRWHTMDEKPVCDENKQLLVYDDVRGECRLIRAWSLSKCKDSIAWKFIEPFEKGE